MVFSTLDKRIKYLSYTYHGSCHDFSILKTELAPDKGKWFAKSQVHVDLGYQRIDKYYNCLNLSIPCKKRKNKTLTKKQRKANAKKSSIRVVVENAIGGMKRYRFLSDRLRCHSIRLYNQIAAVAAGIWNLILSL